MKTIYLDMDGVLCDFDGQYQKMFGISRHNVDSCVKYSNWKEFIEKKQFEKLDMLLSAYVLLDFVDKYFQDNKVNIEILSSSGGPDFHDEVVSQKKHWLKKHNIDYVANIVPGGMKKSQFANKNSLLVDDTSHVVDNFKKHGGNVVLHDHHDVYYTLDKIKDFLK